MRNLKIVAIAIALAASATWTITTTAAAEPLTAPKGTITIDGKKPVNFNHQTHLDLGVTCGQCHHDGAHQPRTAEDIAGLSDAGKLSCVSCHNNDFDNPKLRERKDIFHARCKECHKAGVNGKQGPTSCTACHIKQKKAVEGC
jgi:hypothetical protein